MVYFIIFMENMYRTFFDELQRRKQGSGSVTQTQAYKRTKVKRVKKGKKRQRGRRVELHGHREESHDRAPQQRYRGQRGSEMSHTPAEVTAEKHSDYSHDLGNRIVVQIVKGDITCEQTDAIVNSTNRELSLGGGGVSAALLKKAGKDLQKACNEKKEEKRRYLSEGKVVDTRSGNLQCKRVFHIVFQKQTFVEVVGACINKAVELKFTSIAFPGIGTGMEGFPPEAAAKEMINGLQKCTVPYDLDVRIVLFEDTVYRAFITVIRDHQSTWLGRAGRATGRALKSLFWVGQMEQELGEEPMDVDTQEHLRVCFGWVRWNKS
jgi:O-acetyl-ADP-ribose deacetylase (regulator of RNase III)